MFDYCEIFVFTTTSTNLQRRLGPVDDLGEGQPPAVGQEDGNATGLKRLHEPVGAETSATRYEAKRRVGQQVVVVPPKK